MMMELISAALVTDTELIVSQSVAPQVIDWLYDHGHKFDCWEGFVRSSEGKYTLSSKYCMPKGKGTHGFIDKNDMKETINSAYNQFFIDNDARGQELYIIIKLKDKTDIAYKKLGNAMRISACVLGTMCMVIPIVLIADWLTRGGTLVFDGGYGALVTIVFMPLIGVVALWSSIKARGPGPFGDPNWFDKAALRFKVQYPDGKRKWKLWE